jgi:hypothetical protein
MTANRNFSNSDKNKQKTRLIFLGIFTVAILVFWTLQMQANIKGPLQLGDEYSTLSKNNTNNIGTCTGPDCLADTELRDKDTDKDFLSDWEELNIYGTSPYLDDSDSDGIFDKEEIDAGTDPNCAKGTNCDVEVINPEPEKDITAELNDLSENISVSEGDKERLEKAMTGNIDVESLRMLMIESGIDQEMVDSFSDEELMTIYQETLAQQGEEQ